MEKEKLSSRFINFECSDKWKLLFFPYWMKFSETAGGGNQFLSSHLGIL